MNVCPEIYPPRGKRDLPDRLGKLFDAFSSVELQACPSFSAIKLGHKSFTSEDRFTGTAICQQDIAVNIAVNIAVQVNSVLESLLSALTHTTGCPSSVLEFNH